MNKKMIVMAALAVAGYLAYKKLKATQTVPVMVTGVNVNGQYADPSTIAGRVF